MSQKGRCTNYANCKAAIDKIIQEIPDGAPFICKDCKKDLKPLGASKKKKKGGGLDPKMMIIIVAVVVIGIIVALIFTLGGGKEEIIEPIVVEEPIDSIAENPAVAPNRSDTLVIKVEGMESATDTVAVVEEAPKAESQPQQVAPKAPTSTSSTSKNLGYGTWTGGWKNGQPHGMGTMTYSTSHTIDARDTKGRVAQPGEYIVGEWDNGHLVQGRWFKKDGTKEAVIIGKAG